MAKFFITAGVVIAVIFGAITLFNFRTVPAGHVGVKVYLWGESRGVSSEELATGRYLINPFSEDLFLYPTFTQNYVWTAGNTEGSPDDESFSFQTREGLVVGADAGISYAINPNMVSSIFEKYRRGIGEITDVYIRNMVRDALVTKASTLAIEAVYGEGKTALMASVEEYVRSQVEPLGINIERIYWIGELRLPDSVVAAIDAKIGATQKAQQRENEIQQAIAEAQIRIEDARGRAESILLEAEAQAEANRLLAESLTAELVEYRALDIWDGVLPVYVGGEGPTPFVNVTQPSQ